MASSNDQDTCHNCTLHSLPKLGKPRGHGPIISVHRIFFLAAAGGIFGSAYLGLHLWLMRNGEMTPWPAYLQLRALHSVVQLFAFFGLFAVGFVYQAGPSFLGVGRGKKGAALPVALAVLTGVILTGLLPQSVVGPVMIAFSFIGSAWYFAVLLLHAELDRRLGFGIFVVLGFCSLGAAATLNLELPVVGLFALWAGIGSFVFAAAQKFISGSLGGRQLSARNGLTVFVLHLTTSILILLAATSPQTSENSLPLAGIMGGLTLLVYATATRLDRSIIYISSRPIALAMVGGICWGAAGCWGLTNGSAWADLVLHTWALGWFLPLIIAVSSQIIGHLANRPVLQPRTLIVLLAIWQIVPFGRGFGHSTFSWLPWAVSVTITVVLCPWAFKLFQRIGTIETRSKSIC
jgi:hypothetical protein